MPKQKKSSLTPLLLIGAGILLIVAALIWQLTLSNQNPAPKAELAQPGESELPFPEVTRISLVDAKAAHDTGTAIFLDVRDSDTYDASHIPGAVNIELAVLPAQLSTLDPSRSIITYCT